jgi:hypothetical protein
LHTVANPTEKIIKFLEEISENVDCVGFGFGSEQHEFARIPHKFSSSALTPDLKRVLVDEF